MSSRMLSFVADTLALVIFFTIVGALNERFLAGMSWEEVATARAIGAPLMVISARPYGVWRDWFMAKFAAASGAASVIADAAALLIFQTPIYLAIIIAGGARGAGILFGAMGFAALMLLLGRPYGVWLDFVRRRFGLSEPGQKPMSLGG